jgi:hypothetical protein
VQVYGPPGTEDVVRRLREAYTKDIDLQMFGLEALNATGYILKAKDVLPGQIYKDNNVLKSDEFSFFLRPLSFGDGRRPIAL